MENTRMLRGNNILRKIKYRALVWVKHNKIDVKKIQTVSINMEENKIRLPLDIYLAQNKIIVPTSNILPRYIAPVSIFYKDKQLRTGKVEWILRELSLVRDVY
jgi:hypothetical protein